MSWFRTAIVGALLFGLTGCDLFRTREAEPPATGGGTWETPRVPAGVLTNLRNAMSERRAENYLLSFDEDSFRFEADEVALTREPDLAGWNHAAERSHVYFLFPRAQAITVQLLNPDEVSGGDTTVIRVQYEISVLTEIGGVPSPVAGTAEFRLRMGAAGYWQIYFWKDSRTGVQSTWSDLKAQSRG